MNKTLQIIKNLANKFGVDIVRIPNPAADSIYSHQFGLNQRLGNKIQKFEIQNFNSISESASLFISSVRPGSQVIFDIGGNTGLFSLIISNTIKPREIHLFEPVTEYIEFSKKRLSSDCNFVFNNVGCSNTVGNLELFMDSNNLGWNTVVSEKANSGMEKRKISCIRLSDYIRDHNIDRIDAIKIDVEGHEYYILDDLFPVLASLQQLPVILVEIGWGSSNPVYDKLVSLLQNYFEIGYKPVDLSHSQTFDVILEPVRI